MTYNEMRKGDVACLGRLINGPLDIGAIPEEIVKRLTDRGLARKVLGSCNITCAGQLSFRRHSFTNASRQRFAYVTRRRPVFLHEARFRTPISRARLTEFQAMRTKLDARAGRTVRLFKWLARTHLKNKLH